MKPILILAFVLSTAIPLLADDALPAPWKHQDIGAVTTPGSVQHADGVFTVAGTMDLWGTADGCHIVWQPVHADVELIARVTAIDNPGAIAHAKASLLIRESLDPGARAVTVCVTAGDGTQFLYRDQKDGKTIHPAPAADAPKSIVPKGKFPCWLKIVRHGNDVTCYESLDGQTWQQVGQIKLDLATEAVVGLAASSHKPDVLTKATFDRVKVSTSANAPSPH